MRRSHLAFFFLSLVVFGSLTGKGFYDDQGRFYVNIRWNQAMKWWSLYDRSGNPLGTARWNEPMKEYTFYDSPGNRLGTARFNPPEKTWYLGSNKVRWEPGMSTFYFSNGGKAVWFSGGWRIKDAGGRPVGVIDLYANKGGPDLPFHIPFLILLVPRPPPPAPPPAAVG